MEKTLICKIWCILILLVSGCEREVSTPVIDPARQQTPRQEQGVALPRDRSSGDLPLLAVSSRLGLSAPQASAAPMLMFAMYPSGKIVFSSDSDRGGPPYLEKYVSIPQAREVWGRACALVASRSDFQSYTGPDMNEIVIVVKEQSNRRYKCLVSSHEFYESGTSIATQDGLVLSQGKSSEDIKATWTSEYRSFREVWAKLRGMTTSMVVGEGNQIQLDSEIEWVAGSGAD